MMTSAVRRLRRLRACAALHAHGIEALVWILDDIDKQICMEGLIDSRLEKFVAGGEIPAQLMVAATGTRRVRSPEDEF